MVKSSSGIGSKSPSITKKYKPEIMTTDEDKDVDNLGIDPSSFGNKLESNNLLGLFKR